MKTLTLTLAFLALLLVNEVNAQTCTPCTYTVHHTDSSSYTVNTGEILCLDSTAKFSGTITLNGGTICNKGFLKPKVFNFTGGTVYNYHSFSLSNALILNGNCILSNLKKSIFKINGALTISGGSFINKGISGISNSISFTSGILNNSSIINCTGLSGNTTSIINSGIINKN